MNTLTFTISLPRSGESFGQWLEATSTSIDIWCALGEYHVTLSRRKVHSHSDKNGSHTEDRRLTRTGASLHDVLNAAIKASLEWPQ